MLWRSTGTARSIGETLRLTERIVIVTGAAGGIGSAIALACAREGADLCLVDARPAGDVARAATDLGRRAIEVAVDVTRRSEVEAMIRRTLEAFGRIEILVNAAGIVSVGAAASLDEAEWDRVLAINLKGTFLCCQAVIEPMRRKRWGRIINLGSVVGKNGGNARPWIDATEQWQASNIAYGVSKAGVHALTFFLARELAADGITVNAIAPGPIASAMTTNFPEALKALIPVGRMGRAEEVAEAALFLASETASFITGEILDLNGGMWAD